MNTIIAFGNQGPAVLCAGSSNCTLSCCDLYGNAGGDWVGAIAGQLGVDGNICADPLFCGAQNPEMPYSVSAISPCAPDYNPECGLIGACPVGCGLSAVRAVEPSQQSRLSLELIAVVPNPFIASARIVYRLGDLVDGTVTLRVHDVAGRLVRSLCPVAQDPGDHSLTWDGRGTDGSPVVAGTYFLELAAADRRVVRRVIITH